MDIESRVREIVVEVLKEHGLLGGITAPPAPLQPSAMPQPAAAPPVPVPPAAVPPAAAPPAPPVGVPFSAPLGVPVASPPGAPATVPAGVPVGSPAVAPPVQAVPTLDDIKALANDFHRANPARAAEIVAVLAGVGATKMDDIPPANYVQVHQQIKDIAGVQ